MRDDDSFNYERLSKSLSMIGAKLATITDILIGLQQEIEELYLSLDNIKNPDLDELNALPKNLRFLGQE